MTSSFAGWLVFWAIAWHALAVGAPVVAGYRDAPAQPMNCPQIVITHGVGSDLRTWIKARDHCATR